MKLLCMLRAGEISRRDGQTRQTDLYLMFPGSSQSRNSKTDNVRKKKQCSLLQSKSYHSGMNVGILRDTCTHEIDMDSIMLSDMDVSS